MTEGGASGASPPRASSGLRTLVRVAILFLLFAAPLAFGAVHVPAYVPLLVLSAGAGLASWAHAHWARAHGSMVPRVPFAAGLWALIALVLLQLVPLPASWLRRLSPGSYAYYDHVSLVPLDFRPISVSPPDTLRGLVFVAAFALLYAAVFREFADPRWRRRLVAVVVSTAMLATVEALWQARSGAPTTIYGVWRPTWDWAVFGPYVSRNNFAGYLVMAVPLALSWLAEPLRALRRSWRRRRVGWLALGDPEGGAVLRRAAVLLTLVVGVVASRSRGGLLALLASLIAPPLVARGHRLSLAALLLLAVAAFGIVGPDALRQSAERGLEDSRLVVWRDALRMLPDFPVLGSGLNSFGTAYMSYQEVWNSIWWGTAHNDYLQALLELGPFGGALVLGLVLGLLRGAAARASTSDLRAGLFGSLVGAACHACVDFNWQIPANAATFVALAGLALQPSEPARTRAA